MLEAILVNNLELVVSAVVAVLGFLGGKLISLFNSKVKGEVAREALQQLASLVRSIAEQLEQEMVPALKAAAADGKLSAEEKKILKVTFRQILRAQLSSNLVDSLKKVAGLTDNQIDDAAVMMLEAYLARKKSPKFFGL